jgi:hypothetical protein
MSKEVEVRSRVEYIADASAKRIEIKSLVVLQFDCRTLYFSRHVKSRCCYKHGIIGISNAEVFRADFITFRNDRLPMLGGGGGDLSV